MLTYPEFTAARPGLADATRALFYQFGVGLAFLGTVRPDGGPRMHPVCPLASPRGLYALLIPSPKVGDLRRDARYALHSFPTDSNEDAAYLTGEVTFPDDAEVRGAFDDQFRTERPTMEPDPGMPEWTLVEFLVQTCLLTRTTGHGDPAPVHTVWHAPA